MGRGGRRGEGRPSRSSRRTDETGLGGSDTTYFGVRGPDLCRVSLTAHSGTVGPSRFSGRGSRGEGPRLSVLGRTRVETVLEPSGGGRTGSVLGPSLVLSLEETVPSSPTWFIRDRSRHSEVPLLPGVGRSE